ncbi:MAG: FHA domain-containing protein [Planctomycetes bacterium]|nr:FHA domain-containing protein [Planctomycetota bacterium]
MPELIVVNGAKRFSVPLAGGAVVIGRDAEAAQVIISEPEASKRHAQVERMPDGRYKVVDLESRNGTRLNNKVVNAALLQNGDVITIGATSITFRQAAEAAGPPPAPARATAKPPAAPAPEPAAPAVAAEAEEAEALPEPAASPARGGGRRGRGERDAQGDEGKKPRRSAAGKLEKGAPTGIILGVGAVVVLIGMLVVGLVLNKPREADPRPKVSENPDPQYVIPDNAEKAIKKLAKDGQVAKTSFETWDLRVKNIAGTYAQASDEAFIKGPPSRDPAKIRKQAVDTAVILIIERGWEEHLRPRCRELQAKVRQWCAEANIAVPPEAQDGFVPSEPKRRK